MLSLELLLFGLTPRKTLKEQKNRTVEELTRDSGSPTLGSQGTGWHGHDILKHLFHSDHHLLSLAPVDQTSCPWPYHEQRLWPCPQPLQLPRGSGVPLRGDSGMGKSRIQGLDSSDVNLGMISMT